MEKGKQSERIEAPEEDDRLLQSLSEACGSQIHRSTGPQVHREVALFCFFACPERLRQPSLEGLQDS